MTCEQKLEKIFPRRPAGYKIFAGEGGIFAWFEQNQNLETAIVKGDMYIAESLDIEGLKADFQAYKKAYKLSKSIPNLTYRKVGNIWKDANIRYVNGRIEFPVPPNGTVEQYLLKASRMLEHWEVRLKKRNPEAKRVMFTCEEFFGTHEWWPKMKANLEKQGRSLSIKHQNRYSATDAFIWRETPEGHEFWRRIANSFDN